MATDDDIEREIVAKGLTAARVTPASIEDKIKDEFFFTAHAGIFGQACFDADSETAVSNVVWHNGPEGLKRLTICVLVLENGFTILGKSAPASASNFDAELGKKIARADAVNQIWPLEGYLLRERLFEDSLITTTQLVVDPLDGAGVPGEIKGATVGVE